MDVEFISRAANNYEQLLRRGTRLLSTGERGQRIYDAWNLRRSREEPTGHLARRILQKGFASKRLHIRSVQIHDTKGRLDELRE